MYHTSSNGGPILYFLHDFFDPASKRGRPLFAYIWIKNQLKVAPADPLCIVLNEMRRLDRRMDDRLKWRETEIHCTQHEAVQRPSQKATWKKLLSFWWSHTRLVVLGVHVYRHLTQLHIVQVLRGHRKTCALTFLHMRVGGVSHTSIPPYFNLRAGLY